MNINNFEIKLYEYLTDNVNFNESNDKKELQKRKNINIENIKNNKSSSKINIKIINNDNLSKREREYYKKYFKI